MQYQTAVEITGRFDYEKLNKAINKAITDNDALRIQIIEEDGKNISGFYAWVKV